MNAKELGAVVIAALDLGVIPRIVAAPKGQPENYGFEAVGEYRPYAPWPMSIIDHTERFRVFRPYKPPRREPNTPPYGDPEAYREWTLESLDRAWENIAENKRREAEEAEERRQREEERTRAALRTYDNVRPMDPVTLYARVRESEKKIREGTFMPDLPPLNPEV